MRYRTTLTLLGLVLALGGYLVLFDAKPKPKEGEFPKAFALAPDAVRGLTLESGGVRIVVTRDGAAWRMTAPLAVRASATVMDELVNELCGLTVQQTLEGITEGTTFGLDPAAVTCTADTSSGPVVLRMGQDTPDGRTTFAARDGRKEVVLVLKSAAEKFRKSVNACRDKALLAVNKAKVDRLEFIYPDRALVVAKEGGTWRVESPRRCLAGAGETEAALDFFYNNPVEEFVADGVKDFAPYGLDKPRFEIRLREAGQAAISGYQVGSKSKERGPFERYDTFYVRPLGTDSVMTFKVARADDYGKEARHFRPRRLLAGGWEAAVSVRLEGPGGVLEAVKEGPDRWTLKAPVSAPAAWSRMNERLGQALRQLEMLEMEPLEAARAAILGLDRPQGRVTVGWDGGLTQVLSFGRPDPVTGEIPLTASGEDFLFTVPPSAMDLLRIGYADLRDDVALAIPLPALQELAVDGPGGHRVFECRQGAWAQVKPERREAPLPGLSALVGLMTPLKAERWVACGPAVPWADHGLAAPAVTVRITYLEGETPRTRTLLLGRRDGEHVAARLDGDDELMLLPARLVDLASGDPAQPAP